MLLTLLFAIGLAGPDLRRELTRESLTGTHSRYRQYIDGSPVIGGEVNVTVRRDGAREELRALAMPPFGPRIRSVRGVWVNVNGSARLATRTIEHDGVGTTVRYLDRESGALLREEQNYFRGKPARVFDPNPVAALNAPELRDMEDASAAVPAAAYREVEIEANETGPLGGPWVQISDFQGPSIPPVDGAAAFQFDRSEDGFEDVNAYFHIDRSQRHLRSLGYVGPRAVAAYPIETDTHAAGGGDNSFFIMSASPAGEGRLYFGEGGTDDAEDSDLVIHEYAHAIHEWISPATFLGHFDSETRAISEGFGDYWAFSASYGASLASGRDPYCLADWDARCWANPPGDRCAYPEGADCLRRMDSSKTVADFVHGNVSGTEHLNAEIWSSALTAFFVTMVQRYGVDEGRRIADITVLESLFGAPPSPAFASIANRMIAADRFISGGRNSDAICGAMRRKGILTQCGEVPRGELTVIPGRGRGVTVPDNESDGVTLGAFVTDPRSIERLMVSVDIRHRGRGELRVQLIAPDGTVARLYEPSAERAPDLITTFGRDSAAVDSLDVFRGRPALGEWRLRIIDVAFADVATVMSWSLVIQFAGDTAFSERPPGPGRRQVVPVVGRTPGANTTFFTTDVRLLNVQPHDVETSLIFTPSVTDGRTEFAAVKIRVPAGGAFATDDVVRNLFASAGTGQLEIIGEVIVSTRTSTPSDGGTSGFSAPAIEGGAIDGQTIHIAHLRNDDSFRSNIGFAEVAGHLTRVVVRVDGTMSSYDIFPFSHLQVPVMVRGETLHVEVTVEGEGQIIAYGAVVDNRSGDSTFVPGMSTSLQEHWLAPAISSRGALGTTWRTDLAVTGPATVTYRTGGESVTRALPVTARFEDAVATLFDRPGTIGTLSGEGFVSARVWTDGTYGQAVWFSGPVNGTQFILHAEHSAEWRTNIGLMSDIESSVRVSLFSADGALLDAHDRLVPPFTVVQFPLEDPVINGYVRVEVLSGRVTAYGSVIDNRTGDATFVPAR